MPVHLGASFADEAFIEPLAMSLAETGMGHVEDVDMDFDANGEPVGLSISLVFENGDEEAVNTIAEFLERLDAPKGSSIQTPGGTFVREFGTSEGLGLYFERPLSEEDRLDAVEVCTDALEGSAVYQGSAKFGLCTALYFYGDSFNKMRAALTYAVNYEPECRDAFARRLT